MLISYFLVTVKPNDEEEKICVWVTDVCLLPMSIAHSQKRVLPYSMAQAPTLDLPRKYWIYWYRH